MDRMSPKIQIKITAWNALKTMNNQTLNPTGFNV